MGRPSAALQEDPDGEHTENGEAHETHSYRSIGQNMEPSLEGGVQPQCPDPATRQQLHDPLTRGLADGRPRTRGR